MAQASTATAAELAQRWAADPRWKDIERTYTAEDVVRLSGSVREEHTPARRGAERLWRQLHEQDYIHALGALTGGQAVQQVKAGLQAIYLSGWQVAADANQAGHTYPDQSLYPANSVPQVVRRINNALLRADQIATAEGGSDTTDWLAPIVADAEAGFGGPLNAFELTKAMIAAGAAGIHYEDQLASEKKCGHLGGKVLVPTGQHIRTLNAARLAADIADLPTVIVTRTDALAANLLTSDIDERDARFVTGERTAEGFYRVENGMAPVIARGLAYAPYADLIWVETGTPDLAQAREFAEAIHAEHPDQMLAYNCSPSFNWKAALDDDQIATFQRELAAMGYRFQFITLAGFHSLNHGMFDLARGYAQHGMYFYLPKLENRYEARLWNDIFVLAQDLLGIPRGTVRATILIETITAAFEMEEILYELREHSAGLNAGRWDYLFSLIKTFGHRTDFLLPDRAKVTMTAPFMRAYTELLVRTCHKRGAHAIDGMAAPVPSKDAAAHEAALAKVRLDKEREAEDGFDGSWVAHPGLAPVCRTAFDDVLGDRPHQMERTRDEAEVTAADLLTVRRISGPPTREGVRTNIAVALRYFDAWLRGSGAVAVNGLMEDAATAEIARVQIWQWLRHRVIDRETVLRVLDDEAAALGAEFPWAQVEEVSSLFERTAMARELPPFFTPDACSRHLVRRAEAHS